MDIEEARKKVKKYICDDKLNLFPIYWYREEIIILLKFVEKYKYHFKSFSDDPGDYYKDE